MKVITCFSYKGGAGRTVAAANIAAALASIKGDVGVVEEPLNHKVAIIDLDVFSAGTHRVFGISNDHLEDRDQLPLCIQEYLLEQMEPAEYCSQGGIGLGHPFMKAFLDLRCAEGNCHEGFTLFPARPDPGKRFAVQKVHEHLLIELLMELEDNQGFDYVVLDGESGTRSMADIAIRLADVVLMFFRLTWQHIEGSLKTADDFLDREKGPAPPFYLIPTCVPLVAPHDGVYLAKAPGLKYLRRETQDVPEHSLLNKFTKDERPRSGHFWGAEETEGGRICIHESLILKGAERIVIFDPDAEVRRDRAPKDYYKVASELTRLHPPRE